MSKGDLDGPWAHFLGRVRNRKVTKIEFMTDEKKNQYLGLGDNLQSINRSKFNIATTSTSTSKLFTLS